jgi:hypothetical protein
MSLVLITLFIRNYFLKYWYFKVVGATTYRFPEESADPGFSNCRLKIVMKRSVNKLVFDELWIDGRLFTVRVTDLNNQSLEDGLREKQVLYIDLDSEAEYSEYQQLPPGKLAEKIFLGFTVGNKRQYVPVNANIEQVPHLSVA